MAGYAYGLDDGGAIPDDQGESYNPDQDDSGALPVADNSDNSGALPVAAPNADNSQNQGNGPLGGLDFNASHVPGNAKRIMQYLLGTDAAPPEAAKKMVQATQLEHPDLSPDDAQLVAVQKAMQQGGPEAAHQLLQYNRGAYNYKAAVAASLLNGSAQGKAPDLQGAADAATEASKHVLDGSNARFVASPGGTITATVKPPGADNPSSYNLTPQQLGELFNIGGTGQYDRLLGTGGLPAALARLTSNTAQTPAGLLAGASAAQTQEDRGTQPVQGGEAQPPGEGGDTVGGDQGGFWDAKGQLKGQPHFDDDLVGMARVRFPWMSQGAQRNAWLTTMQEQRNSAEAEQQNKVAVAKEQGTYRFQAEKARGSDAAGVRGQSAERVAQTNAGARVEAAKTRAQAQAAALMQKASQFGQSEQGKNLRALVSNQNAMLTQGGPEAAAAAVKKLQELSQQFNVEEPQAPQAPQTPPAGVGPLPGQDERGRPQTRVTLPQQPQPVRTPQDQQALVWARANPNDPRAAKIMQHLNMQ